MSIWDGIGRSCIESRLSRWTCRGKDADANRAVLLDWHKRLVGLAQAAYCSTARTWTIAILALEGSDLPVFELEASRYSPGH